MSRNISGWRNAFCLLLLAAALMMRALMPGGIMIAQDRSGDLVVAICNSDQTLVIPMKPDAPASDEGDKGEPCAFASLADNATPPDPLVRPPLPQLAQEAYNATRARTLSPTTPTTLPPATGPPLTV